jgi:hypothetical protein
MATAAPIRYEGTTCELAIHTPADGVVVLTITGHDVGEFGSVPMTELEKLLSDDNSIELYIDARDTQGASVEVSSEWALWLGANRARFKRICMLTGSRFVQLTAGFVRSFSGLEDVMRIYTDAQAFDEALAVSVGNA